MGYSTEEVTGTLIRLGLNHHKYGDEYDFLVVAVQISPAHVHFKAGVGEFHLVYYGMLKQWAKKQGYTQATWERIDGEGFRTIFKERQ